jgi:hypothetical protein
MDRRAVAQLRVGLIGAALLSGAAAFGQPHPTSRRHGRGSPPPVVAAPASPPADPVHASRRRALLEEARRYGRSGNHEQAAATLLEAARTAGGMNPSLRLLIATEYAGLRWWRETWDNSRLCVLETREAPADLADRAYLLQACGRLLEEASAHGGRVGFVLPADTPADARVSVAAVIPRDRWTDALPLMPGPVTVSVEASGYEPFRTSVDVLDGQRATATVTLRREAPPVAPTPVIVREVSAPTPLAVRTVSAGPGAGPWVLMASGVALGAAGLATSLVLRADADAELQSLHAQATREGNNCVPPRCAAVSATYEAQSTAARERFDAMNVLFGVSVGLAAASVVGGVTWLLAGRARITAAPLAHGFALGATGTF